MEKVNKQMEAVKYFFKMPNMADLKMVEGYEIGRHLGVNGSAFLKTLNAINFFMEPVKMSQQDLETKFAQIMILGTSLLNRPIFKSIEESIKATTNQIY